MPINAFVLSECFPLMMELFFKTELLFYISNPAKWFHLCTGRAFKPTQDIHPTLELKWPFDCELRRCSGPVSGYWYFGGYCLDLDSKQRKQESVGGTDMWITFLRWTKTICETPTCWKQACTKFSGKRFRMRSNKASTLDTSSFFFPCPRLALSLGFPGWMASTRTTPRTAAITVVDI